MTHQPTRPEKYAQWHNEQLLRRKPQPTTYSALAKAEEKLDIVGESAPDYPAIPSGPWSSGYGSLPQEPPLGFDVSAVEPVGEHFEIARSLRAPPSAPTNLLGPADGETAATSDRQASGDGLAPVPTRNPNSPPTIRMRKVSR
jgi:hypothetical protein